MRVEFYECVGTSMVVSDAWTSNDGKGKINSASQIKSFWKVKQTEQGTIISYVSVPEGNSHIWAI